MGKLNPYLKAVVAAVIPAVGAALTGLAAVYGNTAWYPVAVAVVTIIGTAYGVYKTPNKPAPAVSK